MLGEAADEHAHLCSHLPTVELEYATSTANVTRLINVVCEKGPIELSSWYTFSEYRSLDYATFARDVT